MSNRTDESVEPPAPVLKPMLLARIHELNRDYLDLLAAEHEYGIHEGQLQHLPPRLHAELAALSSAARAALAAIPYTLYSLGFERVALWRNICEPAAQRSPASAGTWQAPAEPGRLQDPFCEVALLHAWHVMMSSRLAARMLFAMPDSTADLLASLPLGRIRRIATEHPALLMPRWPTNPAFWPDLVCFVAAGDAERLGTAKILGSQLIAAELEQAMSGEGNAAPGGRWVRSPRLRASKLRF